MVLLMGTFCIKACVTDCRSASPVQLRWTAYAHRCAAQLTGWLEVEAEVVCAGRQFQ